MQGAIITSVLHKRPIASHFSTVDTFAKLSFIQQMKTADQILDFSILIFRGY
jgi:hypothetical protein